MPARRAGSQRQVYNSALPLPGAGSGFKAQVYKGQSLQKVKSPDLNVARSMIDLRSPEIFLPNLRYLPPQKFPEFALGRSVIKNLL